MDWALRPHFLKEWGFVVFCVCIVSRSRKLSFAGTSPEYLLIFKDIYLKQK